MYSLLKKEKETPVTAAMTVAEVFSSARAATALVVKAAVRVVMKVCTIPHRSLSRHLRTRLHRLRNTETYIMRSLYTLTDWPTTRDMKITNAVLKSCILV